MKKVFDYKELHLTDLMIGDFVYLPCSQQTIKVQYLYNDGGDYIGFADVIEIDWDSGPYEKNEEIDIRRVTPILLSTKILKEFGFSEVDTENKEYLYHDKIPYSLKWDKNEQILYLSDHTSVGIRYVHELQHLLRLYGIVNADSIKTLYV